MAMLSEFMRKDTGLPSRSDGSLSRLFYTATLRQLPYLPAALSMERIHRSMPLYSGHHVPAGSTFSSTLVTMHYMPNFSLVSGTIRSAMLLLALLLFVSCGKDNPGAPAPGPGTSTDTLPPRSGLTMYLPFDGGVADSGLLHLAGEAIDVTPASNRFGDAAHAMSFNGIDSKVTYESFPPDTASGGKALTLAAWIYPVARVTGNIVRRGLLPTPPYSLAVSQTGDIIFNMAGADIIGARKQGYDLNTWTFVAGTYDGISMRLYVNGLLADSVAGPPKITEALGYSPIIIGTRLQLPADTFNGLIDDVLIYHRALSPAEITMLYKAPKK
jgi:hypothetical protein